jgi:hypothetical protein
MARKVQGAEKSSGKDPRAPLVPHLEIFSKAVAEGHSHVEAAEICGRSRGSASSLYTRPGVKERIAELRAIAATANEKAVAENGRQEVPVVAYRRPLSMRRRSSSVGRPGIHNGTRSCGVLGDDLSMDLSEELIQYSGIGFTTTAVDSSLLNIVLPRNTRS